MTLKELEDTLPNGFHDAGLRSFQVNFANGTALLEFNIDMSTTDTGVPEFKPASIYLEGLRGFICDSTPFEKPLKRHLTVSGLIPTEKELPQLRTIPAEARRDIYSFFLVEWNAFVHILAANAKLIWESASELQGGAPKTEAEPN